MPVGMQAESEAYRPAYQDAPEKQHKRQRSYRRQHALERKRLRPEEGKAREDYDSANRQDKLARQGAGGYDSYDVLS